MYAQKIAQAVARFENSESALQKRRAENRKFIRDTFPDNAAFGEAVSKKLVQMLR